MLYLPPSVPVYTGQQPLNFSKILVIPSQVHFVAFRKEASFGTSHELLGGGSLDFTQ